MQSRFTFGILTAVVLAVLYAVLQSQGFLLVELSDAVFVLVSGGTSVLALLVVLKRGFRGKFGAVNAGLFLVVFSWFLGETVWTIYELILETPVPYPSLADVFYLAGYLPAILGVAQFLSVFKKGLSELKLILASLSGLLIIGLTYVYLLNPLMVSETDLITKAFDIAYPSLDAILLILAIAMILVFEGATMANPWVWISLGLFLTALADISFSLGTLQGWYYSGHPIELLWLWGYLSLALGFDSQRKELAFKA
jgi:hypothetical protein